ncbi:MAG: hypothetical protein R3C14_35955 [Caldilineaceae bacterium]
MATVEFPAKVIDILGAEAANAFEQWIDQKLQITTQHVQPVEIPAKIARQKVNVLMLERVGNLLLADEPQLIEIGSGRWVWRVPVDLTHSQHGRVGRVAEIDVDAYSGMIDYTDMLLVEIKTKAQQLTRTRRAKSDVADL